MLTRKNIRILIVDGDEVARMLLRAQLKTLGYKTLEAVSGQEAIEKSRTELPDLVLMVINLPDMDGFEVAREIKRISIECYTPILFVTSEFDESVLAKGIDAGGDDFVSKLSTPIVLETRIRAAMRHRRLYAQLHAQNRDLEERQIHEEHEQEMARDIFSRIAHLGCLDEAGIDYVVSALMMFSGDMLLAERTPYGALRVMLGDFTGHGLPAAVGTLPSAEIFYGMTAKGYHVSELVEEINKKLYRILPAGIFCAAIIFELNSEIQQLMVWNGGLPHLLLVDADKNEIRRKFESSHLALGILPTGDFDSSVENCSLFDSDRLIAYTDGIVETENLQGERYGDARLLEKLQIPSRKESLFDTIIRDLELFRGQAEQSDDCTLIEVPCDVQNIVVSVGPSSQAQLKAAMSWCQQLTLQDRALVEVDPIPLLLQSLIQIQGLDRWREELFIVVTELYTNALDHGVLKLDSSLKQGAAGFAHYFTLRCECLQALETGRICITLEHESMPIGGRLTIRVEDSGGGFDLQLTPSGSGDTLSGRGMQLVRELCDSLQYSDSGRVAEAVYSWQ